MKRIKTYNRFLNEERKVARKSLFNAEDGPYEGWTFDQEWNGFDVPYFEKKAADKIAHDLNGRYHPTTNHYDFPDEGDDEYGMETIMTDDGPKDVYPIGAFAWVWIEQK